MTASSARSETARDSHDVVRALAAVATLAAFVFGVPFALVALAPSYVPGGAFAASASPADLVTRPDDGALLLLVLAAAAWLAWLAFTASVVVEVVASLKRAASPRLPGLPGVQRVAARLVASVWLLGSVGSGVAALGTPALASPATLASAPVVPHGPADGERPPLSPEPESVPEPAVDAVVTSTTGPIVRVERGDTLWSLAERHLGNGARYVEIRDLNAGRLQADGRTFEDADWILPGWTLELPSDAVGVQPAPGAPAHEAAATVTVEQGDTLWDLAAEHLGDGGRYGEILDANRGTTQRDGTTLTDPDLIRPGWVLQMPGMDAAIPAAEAEITSPAATSEPVRPSAATGSQTPAVGSPLEETTTPDAELSDAATAPALADPAAGAGRDQGTTDQPGEANQQLWYLGLTALGAAGVVAEIVRRRRLQHRARRPGELIPMPTPDSGAAAAERSLRAAPAPVSPAALKVALANLGCRCFDAGLDLPRIGAMLLDEHSLTVLLTEDFVQPVTPFVAVDSRTWRAATADIAAERPMEDSEQSVPHPLVVVLGHTESQTLLVNLEAAGTLVVAGQTHVRDVVRALLVELATSPLSSDVTVVVDSEWSRLAQAFEPHRMRGRHDDAERQTLARRVAHHLTATGVDDVLQARGDRHAGDSSMPIVFAEHEAVGTECAPWSGTALVTTDGAAAGWRLDISPEGEATLVPWEIRFRPQRLDAASTERLHELLLTSVPPAPAEVAPGPAGDPLDLLREPPATALARSSDENADPVLVRVLGHVEIEGLRRPADSLSPRMTELIVYLALHGPATGAELDDVLWDGARISAGTRNALVYRTRQKVGEEVLPLVGPDGMYRLGHEVDCDWRRFQRFANEAAGASGDARVDLLRGALDLVRDTPFKGVAGTQFAWADPDIERMSSTIADASLALAQALAGEHRDREALDVALRGLMAEPFSRPLQDLVVQTTAATSGVEQARARQRQFVARNSDLDPEQL